MPRRSPIRRERRLLPQPVSPRTAALVNLDAEAASLRELRESLARTPREIPSKYFYDDRGSALFEQITRLPEYYPTRTERALLIEQAQAIVKAACPVYDVVELGSGAAEKTVGLLDAVLADGGRPRYIAVDISAHALGRTRDILAAARPEVPVEEGLADDTRAERLPEQAAGGGGLVVVVGGAAGDE